MHLLTEQQLAQLSSLDVAIYHTLLGILERESAAPFLVDDESGFFFVGPEILQDDPYVVNFRLRFHPSGWPGIDGDFNPCPEGVNFYFFSSAGISSRAGRFKMWPMLRWDYPSERVFLDALRDLVCDWLTGQTHVEVTTANGVPYEWTVRRRGSELCSYRRFFYPFWGRKAVEIRACRAEATPANCPGSNLDS
jgi:hypothetical protein